MRVNFDSHNGIIRSVKTGGWDYHFKEAGSSNPALEPDRDKIKSCTGPVPDKFKDECEFLVVNKMGNGYSCWLSSKPGKSGHALVKERSYVFGETWKKLYETMKENHGIIIPSDRQAERMEDFVSRVNGNEIDLRKYEEFMELERY